MNNALESGVTSEKALRIVGIAGSLRPGSYTRRAVEIVLEGARETGAQVHLIDLQRYGLVFCTGDESSYPGGVFELRREVQRAQGIILGTPEYHGSFSGVLKNALDLMGFAEFEGKMIGLVGVSAGQLGALDALSSLRTIGRALHAWVVPDQVAIPRARKYFQEGRLQDPQLETRLKDLGRQVARFAYLHSSKRARDFLREWEKAPPNPGGDTSQSD